MDTEDRATAAYRYTSCTVCGGHLSFGSAWLDEISKLWVTIDVCDDCQREYMGTTRELVRAAPQQGRLW